MNAWAFVRAGLRHHRRSHLGVLAGAALGAMVLLGALLAGDAVKWALRRLAEARLGTVERVLAGGDRLFRAALADGLAGEQVDAAPVLAVEATASAVADGRATGAVQVLGVDRRFWGFAPGGGAVELAGGEVAVNGELAEALGLAEGGELVLRFRKPGPAPADAPLAAGSGQLAVLRGRVGRVVGERDFGRFNLGASQLPRATVMVPLERLQRVVGQPGKANLLLLRDRIGRGGGEVAGVVRRHCTLDDYGVVVADVPRAGAVELQSARVFFDRRVEEVIRGAVPGAQPVLTYLAVTLAANGRETPYSMVTAVGREAAPFLPARLEGAVLNEWAAADLAAKAGDELRIDYYAVGGGNRLELRSARLPVAGVVALAGLAGDPQWMPEFPGVAAAEDAADWDPGFPLDLGRIRDLDEDYWDRHRGTPKAFLPLETGRGLFANRWGECTALRVPGATRADVGRRVLAAMTPADAGLVLRDVRAEALAAAASPVDFGGLLLAMSCLLMASAVALTALLLRFHLEQRTAEGGLLAALGVPPRRVLCWRLGEALCVVTAGAAVGGLLAAGHAQLLLGALDGVWGAGGRVSRLHLRPATVAGGLGGFVAVVMAAAWLVARRQVRRAAGVRLAAGAEERPPARAPRVPWPAIALAAAGGGAVAAAGVIGRQGAFFAGGAALLAAGLALYRWVLGRRAAGGGGGVPTAPRLAALNCARRPARSVAVVGCLAGGVFMVVAVAAFRKHGSGDWRDRSSGTGGFACWVETTTPVPRPAGADDDDWFGLGEGARRFAPVVALRVGAGDDADCFNLNAVARPRLLATDAKRLAQLGAFPVKQAAAGCARDWTTLRDGPVMRAFVDETTLLWALKRKLGERIVYQDEWGRAFEVELAGTLADTVLQGSLVVDEGRFLARFPSSAGHRLFLTACDGGLAEGVGELRRAVGGAGGVVWTTQGRLAAFHGVENRYLAVFHVLGGLGVVLGSAGLGLLTARNLADRRHEFAVLEVVGVGWGVVRGVVMREVRQFTCWGLGIGVAAAVVAVLPGLPAGGGWRTAGWVALLVGAVAGNAWLCSWLGWRWQAGRVRAARAEVLGEGGGG